MHLSDMKAELKKFGAWLVTPDRVNNVIRLVLSLTGTSTPVYLTLEVLEMFHITDLFLKEWVARVFLGNVGKFLLVMAK